jgi:hypothetical protein
MIKSRSSAVRVATGRLRVPVREFVFLHIVQTGSGAHSASYLMDIGGAFLAGKAAGA